MKDIEWFEKYYVPFQKRDMKRRRFKSFFCGFIIAAFLFTGLGYWWRMAQTKGPYEARISELTSELKKAKERLGKKEGNRPVIIIKKESKK